MTDQLFDDHFDGLYRSAYRVAYRLLGSREDAADCAQEACARAFADWSRLSGRGDVAPWVMRVSSNLAIDGWRSAVRQRAYRPLPEMSHTIPERVDLHRAIRSLPRRQREVVVLRYIADMSEAAVAEALGCSVGTVKTHASRALVSLRRVLVSDVEE